MSIKINLSTILGQRRMKIAELSRLTGISRHGLYEIYHERRKGIEFDTLAKICKALGCTVGELLEYVEEE